MATQISAILLNISHIAYIINGEYCWIIWLQQVDMFEFLSLKCHALISIEVAS